MNAVRMLTSNIPGLFKHEKSISAVRNQENRTLPGVFTVQATDTQRHFRIELNPFVDNLKPFIFVMRAMGVCPVRVTNKGNDIYSSLTI